MPEYSSENTQRLAVVLTFAQLPLKLLSAYGSDLGQTPVFDRLAARGILFDQHFAEDLSESRNRHAWWDGRFHFHADNSNAPSLREICTANQVECHLITDCPPAEWDIAPQNWENSFIDGETGERTHSQIFQELLDDALKKIEDIRTRSASAIVWIHSSDLPNVPIPSLDYLDLYLNELCTEDHSTEEPEEGLTADERSTAFALIEETLTLLVEEDRENLTPAQIKTLNILAAARLSERDQQLSLFFSALESDINSGEMMFLLTADRGLALGEATITKQLEREELLGPLQEENAHLPLLIVKNQQALGERCPDLTNSADIPATILDWLGLEVSSLDGISLLKMHQGTSEQKHQQLICRCNDWESIRESGWLFLQNRMKGVEKLYIKPEDRWQVLDVLSQNIDEADRLLADLKRCTSESKRE